LPIYNRSIVSRVRLLLRAFISVVAVIAILIDGAVIHAWEVNQQQQGKRVVLPDIPENVFPASSNVWKCSCDTDGCWPGCFTVAAASVMEYWATKGYPQLWNGNVDDTLFRLRDLFPNLLCYGNGNGNNKPGDTGYDAYDVAAGLREFVSQRGYTFKLVPIATPTYEAIVREIDSGRPVIGAFAESPWGSHAGTIIGYDTTDGVRRIIVRPNFLNKQDAVMKWNSGEYQGFSMVTIEPVSPIDAAMDPPPSNFSITVNDRDAGFTSQGKWQKTIGFGFGSEAHSIWSANIDGAVKDDTAAVRWSPDLPYDGLWEVMAWMPAVERDVNLTQNALYRVSHAEGMSYVRRSQQDATQGWMSLGLFPFTRGRNGVVQLGNFTDEAAPTKLWADSVKFAWRAPLVVRDETDANQTFVVLDGKRHRVPEQDTFGALRFNKSLVRKLTPPQLAQYPIDQQLPSIYTTWLGQYFNNPQLSAPASAMRLDPTIAFRWNGLPPAPNTSTKSYSARWSRVLALTEGVYPFRIESMGGVRLWVDGRLAIDAWDSPDSVLTEYRSSVSLNTGLHRVEIEYVNRTGAGYIKLANLPPNVPILTDASSIGITRAPTTTLKWNDGGDVDGNANEERKFFAQIWRAGEDWSINSNWITATQWMPALPAEGKYQWRVSATDGTTVSDWSKSREIIVDRSPPWAQMKTALPRNLAAFDAATGAVISPALQSLNGLQLTWTGNDALSGIARYDVQARETIRSAIVMTDVLQQREKTELRYDLVLSGTKEITAAKVVTSLTPITVTQPVRVLQPISGTWQLIASGLTTTTTVFLAEPGSAYEFRVRAIDRAGNVQGWFDGYSVSAQIDPNTRMYRVALPLILR
jgi:hypothetical protein